MITTRRVYDEKRRGGGYRVLVDRVWPRGIRKEDLKADLWLRDIAPSSGLRKWFGHDPARWEEFRKRYFRELKANRPDVETIATKARKGNVVLLYGARDTEHNQAVALKEYLEKYLQSGASHRKAA